MTSEAKARIIWRGCAARLKAVPLQIHFWLGGRRSNSRSLHSVQRFAALTDALRSG